MHDKNCSKSVSAGKAAGFRVFGHLAALLAVACCACLIHYETVRADAVNELLRLSTGRLSPEGADFLRENWIGHSEPCRKVSDVGGWLWEVTYASGFKVYNCFRKCRGTDEVARYFLGIAEGDCDSWFWGNDGAQYEVCFPRDAQTVVDYFGPVIAIKRTTECWE